MGQSNQPVLTSLASGPWMLSNVPNILLEIHLELASAGDVESLLLIKSHGPVKLR